MIEIDDNLVISSRTRDTVHNSTLTEIHSYEVKAHTTLSLV